jgi:peptidoglycan-N-acetylglucosamine deacetylase
VTDTVGKRAVLTVDDAPSADWRAKLAVLDRLGIRAVFFCIGRELVRRRGFVAAALAAGHLVGNHGWSHTAFSSMRLDECEREIDATHRLLVALHRDARRELRPRFFRFPFGDKGALTGPNVEVEPPPEGLARKASIQRMLRERGYTQPPFDGVTYRWYRSFGLLDDADWYWTYDTMDWSTIAEEPMFGVRTPEDVYRRLDEDVPEGGRGLNHGRSDEIVLMHDQPDASGLFESVLRRIGDKGIDFVLPAG